MQVDNLVSFKINENLKAVKSKQQSQNTKYTRQPVSFGKTNPNQSQNAKTEEKKPWGFKRITNVAGVTAGIAAIAIPLILNARRPAPAKIAEKAANFAKKLNILKEKTETAINSAKGIKPEGNKSFRFGVYMNKIAEGSKELVNNVIYGFGTVVVMPLVILYSPLGKKDASKDDKWFAVLRQPLSFATMFSMQLTMDKAIKKIIPDIIKHNLLEKMKIQDAAKEGPLSEILIKKLKYDADTIKKAFIEKTEKLGIKKDKINEIFKLGDEKTIKTEFTELLKDVNGKDKGKSLSLLKTHFLAKNRTELASNAVTIALNVIFSAPVGCTLLNVLYGKMMKKIKPQNSQKPDAPQENLAKGGTK